MGWLWQAASLWGSGPGARGGMLPGAPASFVLGWFQVPQLAPVCARRKGPLTQPASLLPTWLPLPCPPRTWQVTGAWSRALRASPP